MVAGSARRIVAHLFEGPLLARRYFGTETLAFITGLVGASERTHSAEVKVVIESRLTIGEILSGKTPRQRATELFAHLGVWDTANNDGVLLYLLLADHAIEIITDRGLRNPPESPSPWAPICRRMEERFRAREFRPGLQEGIAAISAAIAQCHPPVPQGIHEIDDAPIRL
jgi:uncharacterized membrane protein